MEADYDVQIVGEGVAWLTVGRISVQKSVLASSMPRVEKSSAMAQLRLSISCGRRVPLRIAWSLKKEASTADEKSLRKSTLLRMLLLRRNQSLKSIARHSPSSQKGRVGYVPIVHNIGQSRGRLYEQAHRLRFSSHEQLLSQLRPTE